MEEACKLVNEARRVFEIGKTWEAIQLCEKAYTMNHDPKIQRKIDRLKAILAEEKENKASEDKAAAATLEHEARHYYLNDNIPAALRRLEKAHQLCPSDKLERRLGRLKNILIQREKETNHEDVEESDDVSSSPTSFSKSKHVAKVTKYQLGELVDQAGNLSIHDVSKRQAGVELTSGFFLPKLIYEKLYPYQLDGVSWLWDLHKKSCGGILADDMGLGKTFQTIAFLTGYFASEEAAVKRRTALILAPVSVLNTWQSEFSKWAPSLKLFVYYEATKIARVRGLANIQRCGGILLTTYNTLVSGLNDLAVDQSSYGRWQQKKNRDGNDYEEFDDARFHSVDFTWDYLVLDEAHKVKNPSTKAAKAVRVLRTNHRLLLTGTAVQNNLRELWSLFDFTHAGSLLGSQKTFMMQYEKPITRSREKDATSAERLHGRLMAESLRKIIDPFFLRRTKAQVFETNKTSNKEVSGTGLLPRKNEIVVWIYLSNIQESIYRDFLKLDHVKELLFTGTKRSPLVELTVLKKLCDHPRLLSEDQCANLGLDVSRSLPTTRGGMTEIRAPSRFSLLEESGKLSFLVRLLERFQLEAATKGCPIHRTLIFSQSLRLLDMAELVILGMNERSSSSASLQGQRVLRLDGRLKKLSDRLSVLQQFEHDLSYTVMLLTTQVGGVGITITSADRVVILDPSWNPAIDAQAVDRVYRIGQKANVVVYRLITCATVEEKIYRRQVFKDSVIRQTTSSDDNLDLYRYFTRQELHELFTLSENTRYSKTQRQLNELHSPDCRRTDSDLETHLDFITGIDMADLVFGISDHDVLFSKAEQALTPSNSPASVANHLFAQQRLAEGEAALRDKELHSVVSIIPSSLTVDHPASVGPPRATILTGGMHGFQNRVQCAQQLAQDPAALFIPSQADSKRAMLNVLPKQFLQFRTLEMEKGIDRQRQSDPLPGSEVKSQSTRRLSEDVERALQTTSTGSTVERTASIPSVVDGSNKDVAINISSSGESSPHFKTSKVSSVNLEKPFVTSIDVEATSLTPGLTDNDDLVTSFTAMSFVDTNTPVKLVGLGGTTGFQPSPIVSVGRPSFSFPANFNKRLSNVVATSSPCVPKYVGRQMNDLDIVDCDLSQVIEDDVLQNSVQMKALRKSLARSGIMLVDEDNISFSSQKLRGNLVSEPICMMSIDGSQIIENNSTTSEQKENNSIEPERLSDVTPVKPHEECRNALFEDSNHFSQNERQLLSVTADGALKERGPLKCEETLEFERSDLYPDSVDIIEASLSD